MIELVCEQRSPEWYQARAGRITASRLKDVMAVTAKGLPTAARLKYQIQLIAEMLSGAPAEDGFMNAAMKWGIQYEDEAVQAYELATGETATKTGFWMREDVMFGASPDRMIGADGLLEVKCPLTATHVGYLMDGVAPDDYYDQMQGQLWATGRAWCDFLSYDPRLPAALQCFVIRVPRNDERIAAIEEQCRLMLNQASASVAHLLKRAA